MASRSLRGNGSTSALKVAASLTLKGADGTRSGTVSKDTPAFKLSSGGLSIADDRTAPGAGWNATKRGPGPVETVWDDPGTPTPQRRDLHSLAGNVDRIGKVFDEEARSRNQQRDLVDALHKDQMVRLDEIGEEIDRSIADLAVYMDDFIENSRGLLEGTFEGLHEDLSSRIDGLLPRLRELEERGRAVRSGLDEEQASRTRETAAVLEPLREQIEKLAADLQREQQVRETRNAEIQSKTDAAVAALDAALDTESASREQRVAETLKEFRHEQDQVFKRQDKLESGLEALKEAILQETTLEKEQRVGNQDPIVEALTSFIQKFQANAQEQSRLGN